MMKRKRSSTVHVEHIKFGPPLLNPGNGSAPSHPLSVVVPMCNCRLGRRAQTHAVVGLGKRYGSATFWNRPRSSTPCEGAH
jgi:hypothetical protein